MGSKEDPLLRSSVWSNPREGKRIATKQLGFETVGCLVKHVRQMVMTILQETISTFDFWNSPTNRVDSKFGFKLEQNKYLFTEAWRRIPCKFVERRVASSSVWLATLSSSTFAIGHGWSRALPEGSCATIQSFSSRWGPFPRVGYSAVWSSFTFRQLQS